MSDEEVSEVEAISGATFSPPPVPPPVPVLPGPQIPAVVPPVEVVRGDRPLGRFWEFLGCDLPSVSERGFPNGDNHFSLDDNWCHPPSSIHPRFDFQRMDVSEVDERLMVKIGDSKRKCKWYDYSAIALFFPDVLAAFLKEHPLSNR
jgi:hypothetical protein